jgi:L-arabinokinase
MTVVSYVSGHGLGHASRSVEVVAELLQQRADLRIVIRTSARRSVFERIQDDRVVVERCETDTGVVQIDSLRLDIEDTARRAAAFYRDFDRRVADEASHLRRCGATVVIADVPPLAIAAARREGLPSVVVANFTWDWIYAYYPEFEPLAPGVIRTIADAYSNATLALRLPLPGGFDSMAGVIRDIPFIARRSTRDRAEMRRVLGIDGTRTAVLSSFGGYGVDLPYARVEESGLMVLAPEAPPHGLKYEDIVAAVDVVVSKPGYGIVSECIANGTPFLYTSRGRFAEYDVMRAEMPRMLRCRHITQDDLLAGRWREDVDALLAQDALPNRQRVDGAAVAARAILDTQ